MHEDYYWGAGTHSEKDKVKSVEHRSDEEQLKELGGPWPGEKEAQRELRRNGVKLC